jgi:AcrR family transcriptional regulator
MCTVNVHVLLTLPQVVETRSGHSADREPLRDPARLLPHAAERPTAAVARRKATYGGRALSVTEDTRTTILDAARDSILDFGVRRTNLSDVARRAGVSRTTVYRSYADGEELVRAVMTREFEALMAEMTQHATGANARERLVNQLVETIRALRAHPLMRKIVAAEPELIMPYVLERMGATQRIGFALAHDAVEEGQRDGSIRAGDPTVIAQALVLIQQSFLFSADISTEVAAEQMLDELACVLDGALRAT